MLTTSNFYPNSEEYSTEYGTVVIGFNNDYVLWVTRVGGKEHTGSRPIDSRGLEVALRETRLELDGFLRGLACTESACSTDHSIDTKERLTNGTPQEDNPKAART